MATGAQLPSGLASPAGGTDVAGAVGFHQNASGAVAGPFDAWLTLRGLKTLAVRMDRHQTNAAAVAEFLDAHPAVTEVIYPASRRTRATSSPRVRCPVSAAWSRSAWAAR